MCTLLQGYIRAPLNMPTDRELYSTESSIIARIAQQHSAAIVGRSGYYVLRQHPRHLKQLTITNRKQA
jgi:hypothetical protein